MKTEVRNNKSSHKEETEIEIKEEKIVDTRRPVQKKKQVHELDDKQRDVVYALKQFIDFNIVKKFKNLEGKTFENYTEDEIRNLYPGTEISRREYVEIRTYEGILSEALTYLSNLENRMEDDPEGAISFYRGLKNNLIKLALEEKEAKNDYKYPALKNHIDARGYSPLIERLVEASKKVNLSELDKRR